MRRRNDFGGQLPGVVALRQRRANFRSAFSAFRFVSIREIRVKKIRAFANSAAAARNPSRFEFIRNEESRNAGEKLVHGFMGSLLKQRLV
jgi:hypothetical protein